MSTIVVPDDIIHHILEYAEVLYIIRARLMARRVRRAIDGSYELAIRIRLFSLALPISFRYTSGLYLMDLPRQLGRLEQMAEAWQRLSPTVRIRLQDFDFVKHFDPQGNMRDQSWFSIIMVLRYLSPRFIGRKIVMRERLSDTPVNGNNVIDALEIVQLPIDSQGASDEADTLLADSLREAPRTVISLGRSAFSTAVSPSARLLALLTSEGILLQNFPWNIKHPDAIHDLLVPGEGHDLTQARIMACGNYVLFQGSKAKPDGITERPLKLWNWKSGELLLDTVAVDSIFIDGDTLLLLQKDSELPHCYLRTHFLPGTTKNCDIIFYLPRLRREDTYLRMSFSNPSLDDHQPKSLVGIQGHFCSQRSFPDPRQPYTYLPHFTFTAVAVHSLISLHRRLQLESANRRTLTWRAWAPGRARFIVRHGMFDDGGPIHIAGMKAICRISPPPYELGFPKDVENMRRGKELYLVVLDFNRYGRHYSEKYLSRLPPRIPSSPAEEPNAKAQNNAYPGFLAQGEDRCSYMLQQHFVVEDSRGAPIKQLELRSSMSLVPLMHGHAQDGKARTQWTAWEDGFLEWSRMELDVWNF